MIHMASLQKILINQYFVNHKFNKLKFKYLNDFAKKQIEKLFFIKYSKNINNKFNQLIYIYFEKIKLFILLHSL